MSGRLSLVVVGHVDHGKSTVVGRLMADAGALPQGKLEQVRGFCERNSKPFEYAFLLDALKDEQAQGITIDVARAFLVSGGREFLILDAPGHIEFLRNMVSGASHASAALLVIDAAEGLCENSRRHATMLSLLGIREVVVLVNKMDLVGRREEAFAAVRREFQAFLAGLGLSPREWIPVCAVCGENLAQRSAEMPWYSGPTLLEAMLQIPAEEELASRPFRMPVQDVYKFTAGGDRRRIIAGTVATGRLRVGDGVVFYPSGKRSHVASIETFPPGGMVSAESGRPAGFTTREQVYVRRGDVACREGEARPEVATRIRASVFWLGRNPLKAGATHVLKLGTQRVDVHVESISRAQDASTLADLPGKDSVGCGQMGVCLLRADRPLACDVAAESPMTGRFVILDGYDIAGGGLVLGVESTEDGRDRETIFRRELKWRKGLVGAPEREERFGQRAMLVLVTGKGSAARKPLAHALEKRLFDAGLASYFLGFGSVLYGVDADLRDHPVEGEDVRRLAEIVNILLDAGLVVVATAEALSAHDQSVIVDSIGSTPIFTVWVGSGDSGGLRADRAVPDASDPDVQANSLSEAIMHFAQSPQRRR